LDVAAVTLIRLIQPTVLPGKPELRSISFAFWLRRLICNFKAAMGRQE